MKKTSVLVVNNSMEQKLIAWFTTGSGWALVLTFIAAGLTAISSHLGSHSSDALTIVSIIGLILHPTNMVAGKSVGK